MVSNHWAYVFDRYCFEIGAIFIMSVSAFFLTRMLLKSFKEVFKKAGIVGIDMNKFDKHSLPEAQGVIAAAVYLNVMFLFIPMPFRSHIFKSLRIYINQEPNLSEERVLLEQSILFKTRLIPFLAALLSICCMIFLGFVDDVLNLRWRHKLLLPTLSSLPLLMVHLANLGTTNIIVPLPLRCIFGLSVDIGFFYYVYMGMLAVFCTNAINIYAGVNGLEVGQSIVISISVIVFNIVELTSSEWASHLFSLYFLIPFTAVSLALLLSNWYPAKLFVGDTFCYFAGMTFAVVGILGHFSKTLMLFFIPQVINFLLSCPQIFRLIPCPRHRLPRFDPLDGLLHPSTVSFHADSLSWPARICLAVFVQLHLTHMVRKDDEVTIDNLTLINVFLRHRGSLSEGSTCGQLLVMQVVCSSLGFFIRYPIAWAFYDRV